MTAEAVGTDQFVSRDDLMSLLSAQAEVIRDDFRAAVEDVEFRLKQAYEVYNRTRTGEVGTYYVEDLVSRKHAITGYVVTPQSPSAGYIAWTGLHVVYDGVDYTIANGNTNKKYAWFIKPASGTTASLTVGDNMPGTMSVTPLGAGDAMIFINNAGVPVSVLESSMATAVAPGAIGEAQLAGDMNTLLTNLRSDITNAQATADGAIVSYFQNEPPWGTVAGPNSAAPGPNNGAAKTGDVWYDADGLKAYRWSGPDGTPVNMWVEIADIDVSLIEGKLNTKVTTYVGTTAPTAPAGGFTAGDLWIDTASGNVTKRWSGPSGSPANSWVQLSLSGAAISGVLGSVVGTGIIATNITTGTLSGGLVGTGISASNVTTGTLTGSLVGNGINGTNITQGTVAAARVGSGVNGAVLTTATGTVGSGQIANGAVTRDILGNNVVNAAKIAATFHMLY